MTSESTKFYARALPLSRTVVRAHTMAAAGFSVLLVLAGCGGNPRGLPDDIGTESQTTADPGADVPPSGTDTEGGPGTSDVACGDGIIQEANGEACDDAGESATCNSVCELKTWGSAARIENSKLGGAVSPQIGVDGSGNAFAVWHENNGTYFGVQACRYDARTASWGLVVSLGPDDTGNAGGAQVGVDAGGNATVVWRQYDGVRHNIYSNRYTAATAGWNSAILLEGENEGGAWAPQIAIEDGNALVVWTQSDGQRYSIRSSSYDVLMDRWSVMRVLNPDSSGDEFQAQVALASNGNGISVWRDHARGQQSIFVSHYDATMRAWGATRKLDAAAGRSAAPQVAMDGSGNAVAVWHQDKGPLIAKVYATRYDAGTATWGAAALLKTDDAGRAWYPQVAMDGEGNATVVWQQDDGVRQNILVNRYNALSASWGATVLLGAEDAGNASAPQVAVDSEGNAFVAWQQNDGVRENIHTRRYDARTEDWGAILALEDESQGDAKFPQVAANDQGNAFAVWQQNDGAREDIHANRYR